MEEEKKLSIVRLPVQCIHRYCFVNRRYGTKRNQKLMLFSNNVQNIFV